MIAHWLQCRQWAIMSALRLTTNSPIWSPFSNAVSVARVIVVLMSIGIRTVGLAGSGGLGTSDSPPSPPAEQADSKTQTTAIYKYFFISIDLKLQ